MTANSLVITQAGKLKNGGGKRMGRRGRRKLKEVDRKKEWGRRGKRKEKEDDRMKN